jgi:predicted DNA-binding transcriptional regulator AlpA
MSISYDSLIQREPQQVQEKSLDDLLTTEQVAEQYKIYSSNSLRFYRSINRTTFPYIKIGRTVRYKRSDIEDTLNSKRVSNA